MGRSNFGSIKTVVEFKIWVKNMWSSGDGGQERANFYIIRHSAEGRSFRSVPLEERMAPDSPDLKPKKEPKKKKWRYKRCTRLPARSYDIRPVHTMTQNPVGRFLLDMSNWAYEVCFKSKRTLHRKKFKKIQKCTEKVHLTTKLQKRHKNQE